MTGERIFHRPSPFKKVGTPSAKTKAFTKNGDIKWHSTKEKPTRWCEAKALTFLLNFIRNHNGIIEESDTFELLGTLYSDDQWISLIKQNFSKEKMHRMAGGKGQNVKLDMYNGPYNILREIWNLKFARPYLQNFLMKIIKQSVQANPPERVADELFPRKIRELQKMLKLNDLETDILLVQAFIQKDFLHISDGHRRHTDLNDKVVFIAKSVDRDIAEIREALTEKSRLCRYVCIDNDLDFNSELFGFLNGFSSVPIANIFFERNTEKSLPWDFYGAVVEKHGELLERIITSRSGTKAANILLYGAPGTGKTSFAKTLAERLRRSCYLIKQKPGINRDAEGKPEFRFGALGVCADMVDPTQSLIIVDEADEMLRGGGGGNFLASIFGGNVSVGDKGRLNMVLDSSKVPTIWITNTPAEALDESSRRRFDYAIRFEPLTDAQRKMIWRNNICKMNLEPLIPDELQTKLASLYPVSAGGITLVLQNLSKMTPESEEVEGLIEKLMRPHCELLGISTQKNKMLPAKDYSLSGLNIKGKIPLENIVGAVRNYLNGKQNEIDRPRMNLLLSGAPGTGKTEFVKYLGAVLNTKVIVKMGSDLLDMYVGGTEQAIKQAFAEAEQEHAILFLDEIDGMLQNRERATRNWEVTQVNELLHQMENFNGIMIGATNFAVNLDSAVMRRFTFKLEFDYLDDAGKKIFFERMFHTQLTPAEERRLAAIRHLAPGDFRTVRQSFFYLGNDVSNSDRLDALLRESESKTGVAGIKKQIGF